jgi:hypothetical protein
MTVRFQKIDAAHETRKVLVNRDVRPRKFALKPTEIRRLDDGRMKAKLLGQLLCPLVAEMCGAQDQHASDESAIEHLAGDHRGFDGFPNAYIVGDEQPDWVELEGQNEWQELIWPRPEREPTRASKRRSAAPQ